METASQHTETRHTYVHCAPCVCACGHAPVGPVHGAECAVVNY